MSAMLASFGERDRWFSFGVVTGNREEFNPFSPLGLLFAFPFPAPWGCGGMFRCPIPWGGGILDGMHARVTVLVY